MQKFLLFVLAMSMSHGSSQKFEYLGGEFSENDFCWLDWSTRQVGVCKTKGDCTNHFDQYKQGRISLKICAFGTTLGNDLFCCPRKSEKALNTKKYLDFSNCVEGFLDSRDSGKYYKDVLMQGHEKITKTQCEAIDRKSTKEGITYFCEWVDGKAFYSVVAASGGHIAIARKWKIIAAIGWTERNREVDYKCGGFIISDRFIVTAAHCGIHNKKFPDTVRLTDRFLKTTDDDEVAQQLVIKKVIIHPNYKSSEVYHDIAVVMTATKIVFNKFTAPGCIPDEDPEQNLGINYRNQLYFYTGGYGETEERNGASNILLSINVDLENRTQCSEAFDGHPKMSQGISHGQICVKGSIFGGVMFHDTCHGDSGTPIQYEYEHRIKDPDYNITLIKTEYAIPIVVGLVSFGIDCFVAPSVGTRVPYYKQWIESVIASEMSKIHS